MLVVQREWKRKWSSTCHFTPSTATTTISEPSQNQALHWAFHLGDQKPKHLRLPPAFSQARGRGWIKWRSQDTNQHPHGMLASQAAALSHPTAMLTLLCISLMSFKSRWRTLCLWVPRSLQMILGHELLIEYLRSPSWEVFLPSSFFWSDTESGRLIHTGQMKSLAKLFTKYEHVWALNTIFLCELPRASDLHLKC